MPGLPEVIEGSEVPEGRERCDEVLELREADEGRGGDEGREVLEGDEGREVLADREGDEGREVLAGGTASLYVLAMSVSVVPPSVLGSRAESVRGVL